MPSDSPPGQDSTGTTANSPTIPNRCCFHVGIELLCYSPMTRRSSHFTTKHEQTQRLRWVT